MLNNNKNGEAGKREGSERKKNKVKQEGSCRTRESGTREAMEVYSDTTLNVQGRAWLVIRWEKPWGELMV